MTVEHIATLFCSLSNGLQNPENGAARACCAPESYLYHFQSRGHTMSPMGWRRCSLLPYSERLQQAACHKRNRAGRNCHGEMPKSTLLVGIHVITVLSHLELAQIRISILRLDSAYAQNTRYHMIQMIQIQQDIWFKLIRLILMSLTSNMYPKQTEQP